MNDKGGVAPGLTSSDKRNLEKKRDLTAGFMKHSHPIGYQDLRTQFKDNLDANSFVFREIPKHRTYRASEGFSQGKSFSAGNNVTDCDVPELVVFLLEDNQQFVKDICVDREESTKSKSSGEDCGLDHNRISCPYDPDMESGSELNEETLGTLSSNSNESKSASQHPCSKEGMKNYSLQNLTVEGEAELVSGDNISRDHPTKKTRQKPREFSKRGSDFSRSVNSWQIGSFSTTIGSRREFPHCAEGQQFPETTSICRPETASSQSLTDSGISFDQQDYHHGECSSCAIGPVSGPTVPATKSRRDSHQSNDSSSSTHSFAFPILPTEWSGSPVRMAEVDRRQSRKHQWRKIFSPCCK